jgi:DNA-3-methyladenine glycosylase II
VVSSGDLGIRRAVQLAYHLDEMPTPAAVEQLAERWRPHRSLASIYLWESLAGDVTVGGV